MTCNPLAIDVNQAIADFAAEETAFAVATVLQVSGSAPREAGTKAIIDASGTIHGTIGGGQVEAEAQRRAVAAIRSGEALVFDFALAGRNAEDTSPICGGSMRILIDPAAAAHCVAYGEVADSIRKRCRGVLLTHIDTARQGTCTVRVHWLSDGSVVSHVASADQQAIQSVIESGKAQLLTCHSTEAGSTRQMLAEPIVPPPLLIIAGGGHVGQALALQASLVGFQVMVLDDREEFTDASLYPPGTITRCCDMAAELAQIPLAGDTYVAVVTRGHQHDQRCLGACIARPAGYIGMIGSKRKVAMLRQALVDCGAATPAQFERVYAPIGLDIGAQSVPEIAVSIVAQLIAVRRKGDARAAAAMPRSV